VGSVNVPVVCAGICMNPGNVIVAGKLNIDICNMRDALAKAGLTYVDSIIEKS
jgi:regulator of RNase E activity RraA